MENQDYNAQYDLLKDQAKRLDDGDVEQISLFEKTVNLADLLKDKKLQVEARMNYLKAANYGSYPEKSMTAFSYLLKIYDEDSESLDWSNRFRILWRYKWVIDDLPDFPNIPKSKIESAMKDMHDRYQAADYGMQPVFNSFQKLYYDMGDFELAEEYYNKAEEAGRSFMSDCEACVLRTDVNFLIAKGEYEKAIEMSQPILKGDLTCDTVPNKFYHYLFIPYLLTGQKEKAIEYYKKIETKNTADYSGINGQIIVLKSLLGDLTPAIEIFENNLIFAVESLSKKRPFNFYLASRLLFEKLTGEGHSMVKMKLSPTIPFYNSKNEYDPKEVLGWLESEIQVIEQQFNARNGNDYFTKIVRENKLLGAMSF